MCLQSKHEADKDMRFTKGNSNSLVELLSKWFDVTIYDNDLKCYYIRQIHESDIQTIMYEIDNHANLYVMRIERQLK